MRKIVSINNSANQLIRRRRNRGMAILLVLGLMAVTLAVSYATLRGQGITSELARNNSRALDARAAAKSGLAAALRKMSEDGWAGVGAPFNANVTNNSWYEVSFMPGDTKLLPGDPNYAELPFRVTIISKGFASDPTNTAVRSTHESRGVVQLLRRALQAEPSNWSTLTNSTVYQWGNVTALVQVPVRISGSASILGPLSLCPDYPAHSGANNEYLDDLFLRIAAGKPDHRPLPSPLSIALARQDLATTTRLTTKLGLVLVDNLGSTNDPLTHPGAVGSYRLYPGGPTYNIPSLSGTLTNQTYGPNPATNPLGVFRSVGTLVISNNVTLNGTLITSGALPEVQVTGTSGVVLQAVNLPALNGTNQVYQLPVALNSGSLRLYSNCDAQLKGFTMCWEEFELKQGVTTTKFAMTGNVATKKLTLKGRSSWVLNSLTWQNWKTAYDWNLLDILDPDYEAFFPDFMQRWAGFTVQPALTLQPASGGVLPHWHDWSQPVYQKGSSDLGLKWEVVRWEEET
jgi:hypothetical protein